MIIGIVGAGGIGGYYAGLLSRAGFPVRLLARGEHLDAIRSRGLEIRRQNERFVAEVEASDDGAVLRGSDYVIVAVKGYSLDDVGPAIAGAGASGAAVVPLLNGVDVADRLQRLGVPRESIIGGLARVSVVKSAPGLIERHSTFDRITIGELDRVPRRRTEHLASALAKAGTTVDVSGDIVLDLWRKFAFIVPMSVACGLVRGPAGWVMGTERGRALITNALHEIVLLSRAAGGALSDADEAKTTEDLFALAPGMRPSFLYDLERGGPTELDLLAGAVSRLGRVHQVATPIHDVATAAFEAATQPRS